MLEHLKFVSYKVILEKPKLNRTSKEIRILINLLKKQSVLNNHDLEDSDYKELANSLTFREFEANEEVYSYHDKPDEFYIIVNGTVSRHERNPNIQRWDWAMGIYQCLLEWKKNEF